VDPIAVDPVAVDVVAVDWSGRRRGSQRHIWTAHVHRGRVIGLTSGRDRAETADHLIDVASRSERLVVGLDFAFSLPAWFLEAQHLAGAGELWRVAQAEGERWLAECAPPFWGRPGRPRPPGVELLRRTERAMGRIGGHGPTSAFQIGGAGSVGTGSIRGMPVLRRLRGAGFHVWPFDGPGWPRVIEIYPRRLTGPVVKRDPGARAAALAHWALAPDVERVAAAGEDAFDALVSALVMARHAEEIGALAPASDAVTLLEGWIWAPVSAGGRP